MIAPNFISLYYLFFLNIYHTRAEVHVCVYTIYISFEEFETFLN